MTETATCQPMHAPADIRYITSVRIGVVCPPCANKESAVREADKHPDYPDYDQWQIVASDINWEDSSLTCDNCSQRIESAYAEREGGAE